LGKKINEITKISTVDEKDEIPSSGQKLVNYHIKTVKILGHTSPWHY